jgi:hypothetical protein
MIKKRLDRQLQQLIHKQLVQHLRQRISPERQKRFDFHKDEIKHFGKKLDTSIADYHHLLQYLQLLSAASSSSFSNGPFAILAVTVERGVFPAACRSCPNLAKTLRGKYNYFSAETNVKNIPD